MSKLRTPEGHKKYLDAIAGGVLESGCVLCKKEAMKAFKFWKVVDNDFPYDRIAKTHHMLVPLRHITESEFSTDERDELLMLKETYLNQEYEYLLEATRKTKSIPAHFHIHLIVSKEY